MFAYNNRVLSWILSKIDHSNNTAKHDNLKATIEKALYTVISFIKVFIVFTGYFCLFFVWLFSCFVIFHVIFPLLFVCFWCVCHHVILFDTHFFCLASVSDPGPTVLQ